MPDGAVFDEMGIMVTDDGRLVVHGHTTYALRLVGAGPFPWRRLRRSTQRNSR
jgi:hypothetical protein